MKKKLDPTLVYVLSIFSLVCCCFGGLGILLSAPAYFIAGNQIKTAQLRPNEYDGNTKAMEIAKIVAMITMIINIIYLIASIYRIATVGWDEIMLQSTQAMEDYQTTK